MRMTSVILVALLLIGCQNPPKKQEQNASSAQPVGDSRIGVDQGDTANPLSIEKLRGLWMGEQYAQILKSTRSPRAAYYPPGMYVPFCEIHESGIQWGIHSGDGLGIGFLAPIYKDNMFVLYDQKGKPLPDRFIVNPSDTLKRFTWIHPANKAIPAFRESFFLLSDTFEQFCNQYAIAGTYADSNGMEFSFSINGIAKWPRKQFRYGVNADYAFGQTDDYLINFDENDSTGPGHVVYGFRWNGNRLTLYHEKPYTEDTGEQILLEDHPFVELRPK